MNLKDIRLFLFDMDGTIYLGYDLFPFTKKLLETIRAQGKRYIFMTNNSSMNVEAYVEKMRKLGIETTTDDFLTSSQVTAMYLSENLAGKKIYASGTKSFVEELSTSKAIITEEYSEDIEGVVMGYDTELTYKKLWNISKILTEKDVPYIAANPDLVCPTEFGAMPLFAISKMAELDPSISVDTTLVIGDRLYTDIACGLRAGAHTLLVFSGETTPEQAEKSEFRAEFKMQDCGELLKILEGN